MGSGDPMGKGGRYTQAPLLLPQNAWLRSAVRKGQGLRIGPPTTPAPKTQPASLQWSKSQEPPAPRNSASWKATITHADQAAQHSVKIQSLGVCREAQKRRENTTVKHSDSFPQSRLATSSPPLQRGAASSRRENGAEG